MGTAIQFDTLRYVERLKSAGISEAQAKAKAEALVMVLGEFACGLSAAKDGMTDLKSQIADIKFELNQMKLMVAILMAGVVFLVAKAFS